MGTTRTKRKNAAKRRARRVFAAIAAELQASEEKRWTPEALELERMRNEEERQRVHETWKRAVDASNEAFQKQKRILDERTRLLAAIREELEQEKKEKEMEKSEHISEKASADSVAYGESDSLVPSGTADIVLDEGVLLARDAQAMAYEAMRKAANPTSHNAKPVLPCAFYTRTGCCPFAQDRCGLSHKPSSESRFLLLKNVYQPQAGGRTTPSQKLAEFRKGVMRELEKHGNLVRVEVVANEAPHLKGNVYAEYRSPAQARSAWSALHLRWYEGQRVDAHLTPMSNWETAVCVAFQQGRCTREAACNYLHVYANPSEQSASSDAGREQTSKEIIQFFEKKRSRDQRSHQSSRRSDKITSTIGQKDDTGSQDHDRRRRRSRSRSRSKRRQSHRS